MNFKPFTTASRLPLTVLLLGLSVSGGRAEAVTLGAFQIQASGEQRLNLETGQTELPQGGTATDSRAGLTLTGKTMSYLAGQQLQATGAAITTAGGGRLNADTVTYDVKSGVLKASGHLRYSNSLVRGLSAESISLYTASGVVVASGTVSAAAPDLRADRVVALAGGRQVLLAGHYRLSLGGTRYAGASPEARLLVDGSARPTATPSSASLQPFLPYLK